MPPIGIVILQILLCFLLLSSPLALFIMFNFDLNLLSLATLGLATILVIVAGASDARSFRIPNWVSLALVGLFPFYVYAQETTVPWLEHIGVASLVLVFGFILYAKRVAGAGDAKLLAAISLWAGAQFIVLYLFITAITGGLLSLAVAGLTYLRHRALVQEFEKTHKDQKDGEKPARPQFSKIHIPYGIAIAIGGLCLFYYRSHLG